MVMLPIAQSIVASLRERDQEGESAARISAPLLLAVAYAATIGGMGTLIGTPPNALLAAYMKESHGIQIGFAQWMLIGVPMMLVLLPIAWLVLTRIAFGNLWAMRLPRSEALLAGADGLGLLPPMSRQERIVAGVLVAAALAWLLRPLITSFFPGLALSDAGIAITAAALLFVLPSRWSEGTFLLSWSDAKDIRWDVLILFGGGLALAGGIESSGLAAWIGKGVGRAHHLPPAVLLLLVMATVVYLGELASNTAIAAIFVPVAAAAAIGLGAGQLTLALPVALAASLGFMLPVATPPNAIVFGTGAVTGRQMLRAGAILDVAGILAAAGVAWVLGSLVFGA
jgi:sodium-dependent dicarboxylate transporter 2/3/5